MTQPSTANQNLCGQTYQQIMHQILGSDAQKLQILGTPMSFTWPEAPLGEIPRRAYQIMSAAPAYSATGAFGGFGASTLFGNYRQIFSHVGFQPSPELEEELHQLSNEVTEAQNAASSALSDANSAYLTAKADGGAVFQAEFATIKDWLKGPGSTYLSQMKSAQARAQRITAQIQSLNEANMPSGLQEDLKLLKRPTATPGSTVSPRGWTKVPDGSGKLQWQPAFTLGQTAQNWRAELTKGSMGQKTFTLQASEQSDAIESSWAGHGGLALDDFFGIFEEGAWQQTGITESDSSVTASITVQSSTWVPITPGAWYDGGFLRELATAGNSGTGFKILDPYTPTDSPHALFGPHGLCDTMVTGLVVVYKPSFEVTMTSEAYASLEQKIEGSRGFAIGPFVFGGEESSYTHSTLSQDSHQVFKGQSDSDDPLIVGVTVGFPGLD